MYIHTVHTQTHNFFSSAADYRRCFQQADIRLVPAVSSIHNWRVKTFRSSKPKMAEIEYQMDNLHYRRTFDLDNKNEIPGKNLLKVVKFQNLVEKYCNVWKI